MSLLKLINKIRSACYDTAKVLGDVEAVLDSDKSIIKRVANRQTGKIQTKTRSKVNKCIFGD